MLVGFYYAHLRSICWGMFEQSNQGAATTPAFLVRLFEILLSDQQNVQYPSVNNVDEVYKFAQKIFSGKGKF